MGLDVGVVNISYLETPDEPVYDFLRAMAAGELNEGWGGGWEGNSFVEFIRDDLKQEATEWADGRGLPAGAQTHIQQWIDSLPWQGDSIMFHLNW